MLTALEKLPADRFATAAEFAAALTARGADGASSHGRRTGPPQELCAAEEAPRTCRAVGPGAGARWRRDLCPRSLRGAACTAGPLRDHAAHRSAARAGRSPRAVSPSGDLIAYTAEGSGGVSQVYVRALDQLTPVPLAGAENGCCAVFSPDGEYLAFFQQGHLKRIPSTGGAATAIPGDPRLTAVRWAGNDEFVVTTESGALARLKNDGTVQAIALPDSTKGEGSLDVMQVLPGGRILAIGTTSYATGNLVVVDRRDGARVPLPLGAIAWAAFSDGHLVWCQSGGVLYAATFDPGKARITGPVQSLGITVQQTRGHVQRSRRRDARRWPMCLRNRSPS